MPKIESIRPGGELRSRFGEYPLPEVLVGILRGNLSGFFEVGLAEDSRNYVFFKDGVPISVSLPATGVSLAEILVALGEIPPEARAKVAAGVRSAGGSESMVVHRAQLCADGALSTANRLRARAQLVKLFDVGDRPFCFLEGAALPEGAELAILQPLALIYEGLLTAKDRRPVQRFLERRQTARFRVTDTYPRGVDPFEWGEAVERLVATLDTPRSLDELMRGGLPPDQLAVVLTTLELVEMLDVIEEELSVPPRANTGEVRLRPVSAIGAQISSAPPEPNVETLEVAERRWDHWEQRAAVDKKIGSLLGKSYFEVLRVRPSSGQEQIERAAKFLTKTFPGIPEEPGQRAFRGLAEEAAAVLLDPAASARYRDLAERGELDAKVRRERFALEVDAKVDRAVRRMAEGHTGEAELLLEWAAKLDPSRQDLRLHRAFLVLCRVSPEDRPAVANDLRPVLAAETVKHARDPVLELYLAAVLAVLGERDGAWGALGRTPDPSHPLAARVRALIEGAD